jgi:serine-type D-Ala-D-Ala carboxypeptidase
VNRPRLRRVRAAGLLALAGCAPARTSPPPLPALLDWTHAAAALDSAVAAGAAPGAVLAVSAQGVMYLHGTGQMAESDSTRPGPDTVYDLASLTKVVALTTALMFAVEDGLVDLDAPVARYVPSFTGPHKDRVTVRHLLTHSSGLPAHRRLWELTPDAASALVLVDTTSLDTLPGSRAVYSDLGSIVLTQVLESATGEPLEQYTSRRVFEPLGLGSTRFRPPAEWLPRIAPTEEDPWRARMVRGEVHDENAAWLGGVSGHAGLFGSAEDLLTFGRWLLHTGNPSPRRATVREFTRRQNLVPGSSRALGWDTPSENSSAGSRMSDGSFGHTGFTGTSIWIDPARELVVILLSNRVHPTRANTAWLAVRGLVADRVAEALQPGLARPPLTSPALVP